MYVLLLFLRMNIHSLTGNEGHAEMMSLMPIIENMCTTQLSKPIIGFTFDSLYGCFLLTADNLVLEKDCWYDLCIDARYFKTPVNYTGHELISCFFPDDFNFDDGQILIENGVLIRGQLKKRQMGSSSHGIVHKMWHTHKKYLIRFMSDIHNMTCRYTTFYTSISLTLNDLSEIRHKTKKDTKAILDHVESQLQRVNNLEKVNNVDLSEYRQRITGNALVRVNNAIMSSDISKENSLMNIVARCNAKGNMINISQMICLIGQQSLEGKAIPDGFIKHSYSETMTPKEFFYSSQSGREGISDTALKTASSGYLQRRLVKSMEHIKISYIGKARSMFSHMIIDNYTYDLSKCFRVNLEKEINMISDDDLIIDLQNRLKTFDVPYYRNDSSKILPIDIKFLEFKEDNVNMINVKEWLNDKFDEEIGLKLHLLCNLNEMEPEKKLKSIEEKIQSAHVEAGETVGVIAAHALGEVLTQLTLRTFRTHFINHSVLFI